MEETAKKEKKQSEITEEKDKQPAGKDKEKKEEQELVRDTKTRVEDGVWIPPESLCRPDTQTHPHFTL